VEPWVEGTGCTEPPRNEGCGNVAVTGERTGELTTVDVSELPPIDMLPSVDAMSERTELVPLTCEGSGGYGPAYAGDSCVSGGVSGLIASYLT
jgi:hypothetical protein